MQGEQIAADFLVARGYTILAKRLKTRLGEIDILAIHQGKMVILEVKARKFGSKTEPSEAIGYYKLLKIVECFQQVRTRFPQYHLPVTIEFLYIQNSAVLAHITNVQLS